MCQDCVLWREEEVFQDFTCKWCVGLDLKNGSCVCKNRVCLTHNNIMKKVATFCKYKIKKIGNTLPSVHVKFN